MRCVPFCAAVVAATLCAPIAKADQMLDWSYTFSDGNVLSGVFSGTDSGNYFTVNAIQSINFSGTDYAARFAGTPVSDDFANALGNGYNGNGTAVVSLDGSYMDLLLMNGSGVLDLDVNNISAESYGETALVVYGDSGYDFDQDSPLTNSWSATLAGSGSDVPEPASILLLGIAAPAVFLRRRAHAAWLAPIWHRCRRDPGFTRATRMTE